MLLPPALRRRFALALVVVSVAGAQCASPPDVPPPAGSLALVPADASVYVSSLRMREQVEIVRRSKAWKQFLEIPGVALARQAIEQQLNDPNGPAAMFLPLLDLPENQQLLQLLGDMASSEMFLYGDGSVPKFVTVFGEAYGSAQMMGLIQGIQDAAQSGPDSEPRNRAEQQAARSREGARAFFEVLSEHIDELGVPNLVLGFQISQAEPAQTQLKRLEVLVKMALAQAPQLKNRLKRVKIDSSEYLTLALDGSLVPWDQFPWDSFEEQPEEFAPLVAKLKTLTLNITLGVRGNYLLASLGSSNDHLSRLGKGELLVSRAELKPLAAFAGRRLAGIAFYDQALRAAAGTSKSDLDNLGSVATELVAQFGISGPLQERVATDVKDLIADLKRYVPEIGPALDFSLLTDRGMESYAYDWNENLLLDATKPLPLTSHLGGRPLAALVMRGKYDPQQWDLLAKWARIGYGYFRELVLPEMEADDRARVDQIVDVALPLVARFASATRDLMLPALADSQSALVIDAKLTSKQWQSDMPPSADPLPMIEPALVLGVSDSQLFKRGVSEYLAIANRAIEEIRKADPDLISADFNLQPPVKTGGKLGENYAYPLPAEAGLDPLVAPNAGLNAGVAVFSLAPEQTQMLLADKPLELPATLGDVKRPLAAVAVVDFAGFLDAVEPWVGYGQQLAELESAGRIGGGEPAGSIRKPALSCRTSAPV